MNLDVVRLAFAHRGWLKVRVALVCKFRARARNGVDAVLLQGAITGGVARQLARTAAAIAAAAIVSAAVAPNRASANFGQPTEPKTLDDMYTLFEVDEVPSEFVVVIDNSGSMNDPVKGGGATRYQAVKGAFKTLVDSMSDNDRLSVVLFGGSAQQVYFGDLSDPGARKAAVDALGDNATAMATDIGTGIAEGIDLLGTADTPATQSLIVLTDGRHAPEPGSKYADTRGAAWGDMTKKAAGLEQTRRLEVFGVGVDGEATDNALVKQVFQDATVLDLPQEQMSGFFKERVQRARKSKLESLVGAELQRGRIEFVAGELPGLAPQVDIPIRVTSTFTKLPVELTVKSATAVAVDGTVGKKRKLDTKLIGAPDRLRLRPGESKQFIVRVDSGVKPDRFIVGKQAESAELKITVDAISVPEPRDVLADKLAMTRTAELKQPEPFTLNRNFGTPIWVILSWVLLALIMLLTLRWFYRAFIQVPPLVGVLIPKVNSRAGEPVSLRGKEQEIDATILPGAGTGRFVLYTKRRHPRQVFLRLPKPGLKVQQGRRFVDAEPDSRLDGAQEYRLGGSRFTYMTGVDKKNL